MRRVSLVILSAAALAPAAGCSSVLGLDEFTEAETAGTAGGDAPTTSTSGGGSGSTSGGGAPGAGGGDPGAGGGDPGAGGGGTCEPGEVLSCYDGPEGTAEVGLCRAGEAECTDDGTPGTCEGAVLPEASDACDDEDDEDCTGTYCTETLWTNVFEGALFAMPFDAAALPGGRVAMIGLIGEGGKPDFGVPGVPDPPPDDGDELGHFLVVLDADGQPQWAWGSFDVGEGFPSVDTDDAGNVYVAGVFDGRIAFPGGVLLEAASGTDDDLYVAKFAPDGQLGWARRFGGTTNEDIAGVAASADGASVWVGTRFSGTIVLETTGPGEAFNPDATNVFAGPDFDFDSAVVHLRGDTGRLMGHTHVRDHSSAAQTGEYGRQVLVDIDHGPSGLALTGVYQRGLRIGASETVVFAEERPAFVVVLSDDDTVRWRGRIISGGALVDAEVEPWRIASGPDGEIAVVGSFEDEMEVEGGDGVGPVIETSGPGDLDHFIASFSPSGIARYALAIGDDSSNTGESFMSVAIDDQGNTAMLGTYDGGIDFGDGVVDSAGSDWFLLSFDPLGELRWGRRYGGASDFQWAAAVAFDRQSGDLFLGGMSQGALDITDPPLDTGDGRNIVVARVVNR